MKFHARRRTRPSYKKPYSKHEAETIRRYHRDQGPTLIEFLNNYSSRAADLPIEVLDTDSGYRYFREPFTAGELEKLIARNITGYADYKNDIVTRARLTPARLTVWLNVEEWR